MHKLTGFVEEQDHLIETLTPRETLINFAFLKLSKQFSHKEKITRSVYICDC